MMTLAAKFLIQHPNGDIISLVIYKMRPFTNCLAVLTPYIFLWYRVLNLYKVDSFLAMDTRSVRALKFTALWLSIFSTIIGNVIFFIQNNHHMTEVGCKDDSSKSVDNLVDIVTLTVQILSSVVLKGLMLHPVLSHKGTFGEEEDSVTEKIVRKATKVLIVSLLVTVSVNSAIVTLIWIELESRTVRESYFFTFSSTFRYSSKISSFCSSSTSQLRYSLAD